MLLFLSWLWLLAEMVRLLFDLSSNDWLTLLFAIRKEENLRLTQLAEKIRATIQETSRHVGRLTEAKLIEKNSDGPSRDPAQTRKKIWSWRVLLLHKKLLT